MKYPVVIFCYDRLDMISQTVASLKKNWLANETPVYIFSDGAKGPSDKDNVNQVRQYIRTITGFQKITILERECNFGLAVNIVSGVSKILESYEAVIVLEDDIVTAPYFLDFMNDALDAYSDDLKVCQVAGYSFLERYESHYNLDDTYFIKGADCLAWGTWKRAWSSYRSDSINLYSDIVSRNLTRSINRGDSYNYMKMLASNASGVTNSWAINWLSHNIIEDRYVLFPLKSLALHIGVDNRATNYTISGLDALNVDIFKGKVEVVIQEVTEQPQTGLAYNAFLRDLRGSFLRRLCLKISTMLNRLIGFFTGFLK
jgi:hypothetical protein